MLNFNIKMKFNQTIIIYFYNLILHQFILNLKSLKLLFFFLLFKLHKLIK